MNDDFFWMIFLTSENTVIDSSGIQCSSKLQCISYLTNIQNSQKKTYLLSGRWDVGGRELKRLLISQLPGLASAQFCYTILYNVQTESRFQGVRIIKPKHYFSLAIFVIYLGMLQPEIGEGCHISDNLHPSVQTSVTVSSFSPSLVTS